MRGIAAAALLAMVAGCAQNAVFTKPGGTDASFQADKSACEYEAMKYAGGYDPSLGTFGQALDMASRRAEITRACMGQKGWTQQRR